MRWQNPWAWMGLLTLVLPVLVHLFSRRQTRVEPFPSLRFIDVSRLLPTRRTRLTDVLLLVVRLLILTTAVAALAQPLWRAHASSNAIAVAVIVDTAATINGDTTVGNVLATATSQLRIDTDRPADALAGAAAWLATQAGRRELAIASDFRDGTLDSLDLVLLPRDITVRLVPSANSPEPYPPRAATTTGTVWWATDSTTPAGVRLAVTGAVRAIGSATLADSRAATDSHVVVVAGPHADSLSAWLRNVRPISDAWMGDILVRLHADTTLVTAASGVDLADTTLASPFTVIVRSARGAPVVAAAALGGDATANGRSVRLLLWTRAPAEALATAALLLGASRTLDAAPFVTSGRATPDSVQLRRWERAPGAAPTGAASVRSSDALTGPSDARWMWVAVLALLALETIMRGRFRGGQSAPATAHVATPGHGDG